MVVPNPEQAYAKATALSTVGDSNSSVKYNYFRFVSAILKMRANCHGSLHYYIIMYTFDLCGE